MNLTHAILITRIYARLALAQAAIQRADQILEG